MTLLRAVAALLLLLVGAVSGLAGVLVHARWWGVPLLLAAMVASLLALPGGWWSRLPFAAGWVAAVAWALVPRPEGDFLLASTTRGYLVLGSGLLVATWAIATLPRRRARPHAAADHGEVGAAS